MYSTVKIWAQTAPYHNTGLWAHGGVQMIAKTLQEYAISISEDILLFMCQRKNMECIICIKDKNKKILKTISLHQKPIQK